MRVQFPIWALGALLAVLLAAGCGDSSSGDDGGEVVTKESFLKEADAVCARQKQKIQPIMQSTNTAKAAEAAIEALEVEARKIEALGSPSGDEGEIEAMMRDVRKALDLAGSGPNADLLAANEFIASATEQASNYGLKECFL